MKGLSRRAILGTELVSWTFWTILRQVFQAFLEEPIVVVSPAIILMSPMGGFECSLSRGLLSRMCIRSLLVNELLQLSLSDKGLNLLL